MNTLVFPTQAALGNKAGNVASNSAIASAPDSAGDTSRKEAGALARLPGRFGPFAGVVLLHVGMFYALYSGLLHRVVEVALPAAVYVKFVTPATPAAPPPPSLPKTVSLAPPPVVVPVVPVVVTMPQAVAAPSAPAPAAPVATPPVQNVVAAAAAPKPEPVADPKTLTTGVEYIFAPQPQYPSMSKRMGEQGKVVFRILVNEKGKPDQIIVQTSSGFARLDEAGRQAALKTIFKPHVEDGRAVAVYVLLPYSFSLV